MFNTAASRGLCNDNPAEITLRRKQKKKRQRLTLEQFREMHANSPTWLQNAMEIALITLQRRQDIVSMKFSDIKEGRVVITEGKTGKLASIILNVKALEIVERIRSDNPDHQYLFQSTGRNVKTVKPITRQAVGQAFKAIGEIIGVHLSTHSMRKTRGYHLYQASNDITKVMKMLRHSSQAETLRYIGITQENIDQDFMELVL